MSGSEREAGRGGAVELAEHSETEKLVGQMHDEDLVSVAATILRSDGSETLADELESRFGGDE